MKIKNLLFKLGIVIVFITLLCPTTATGQTLMHSYSFDTDLTDGTGSADATTHGGASVSGGGLVLDANGKYLSFDGTALGLDSYGSITMEYLFEGSTSANTGWNWTGYFGDNAGANNLRNSLGHWNDEIRTAYNGSTILLDGQDVNNGYMHHIVVVLTADSLFHYEDGTRRAGIAIGIDSIGAAQSYLGKGSDAWSGDPTWQGVIYDFNIYDGELTADSIAERATEYLAGTEATLSSLTVDVDSLMPVFNPVTYNYLIIVPGGTTTVNVAATPTSGSATVEGAGAVDVTGGATIDTIKVTSPDGTVVKLYTIEIRFEGTCYDPYFSGRTNFVTDPEVTKIDSFGGWGSRSIYFGPNTYCGRSCGLISGGSIDVVLTGKITTNTTYRVRAMVKASSTSARVGVWGWNGAAGDINTYATVVGAYAPIDFYFTTGATLGGTHGLFFNNGPGSYIDNWEMYEVNNDASLSALSVDVGTLSPAFSPTVYSYSVVVPAGTPSVNVTATKNAVTSVLTGDGTTTLTNDLGTAEVVVTAESGKVNTYTISFSANYSSDSTLSDISIDVPHLMTPEFDPAVFEYDVLVVAGTDTVNISATTSHPGAEITSIDSLVDLSSGPVTATISVLAENDTAEATYTLNISVEATDCFTPLYSDGKTQYVPDPLMNDRSLLGGWGLVSVLMNPDSAYCGLGCMRLQCNVDASCGYPDNGAAFDLKNIPWEPYTLYRVHAMVKTIGGSIGILAKLTNPDFNMAFNSEGGWGELDTTFTTGANPTPGTGDSFFSFNTCDNGSDAEITYIDNYELYKVYTYSSDATLSDLSVGGSTVDGFNKDTLSYSVVLPAGTTDVPEITATATHDSADVVITDAATLLDTALIVVTAENGVTTKTYSVMFTIGDLVANPEVISIMVYPSVSDGVFTVVTNGISSAIDVYDLQGKLVVQQVGGNKQTITITNAGMYIVKVNCCGVTRMFKVIRTN
ncbi:MAG: cadherin-like beta sandwich domain-containing protein [Bacteroidales bacterium]|nr:cadherin-like beta sandwich domain-containing protein [Bacteroidales bacterium]